jgi:hypothetical protein
MRTANGRLRAASAADLGSGALDCAARGFQDRWEYGIGKISDASEKMTDSLRETTQRYEQIDQAIAKLFPDPGATVAAADGSDPTGRVSPLPSVEPSTGGQPDECRDVTGLVWTELAEAAGADVGWGSIALDGIGALPFVGRVAGRGAKVATSAERALRAGRQNVLDYAAFRAEEIGGEVAKKSTEGAKRAFAVIKADGVAGRFHTGVEAAYQNVREGEAIGTTGLNWTIDKLGGKGGIDPLSVGGRALDAGIRVASWSLRRSTATWPGRTARRPRHRRPSARG